METPIVRGATDFPVRTDWDEKLTNEADERNIKRVNISENLRFLCNQIAPAYTIQSRYIVLKIV